QCADETGHFLHYASLHSIELHSTYLMDIAHGLNRREPPWPVLFATPPSEVAPLALTLSRAASPITVTSNPACFISGTVSLSAELANGWPASIPATATTGTS